MSREMLRISRLQLNDTSRRSVDHWHSHSEKNIAHVQVCKYKHLFLGPTKILTRMGGSIKLGCGLLWVTLDHHNHVASNLPFTCQNMEHDTENFDAVGNHEVQKKPSVSA